MKLSTLILLFCVNLISYCAISQTNKIDLQIPDKVEIQKSGNQAYFPNTRVSMVISEKYRKEEHDGNVRVFENTKTSFSKDKASFKESIAKNKLKGAIIYYEKEFKLGDYDAYLMYCPQLEGESDGIILMFGDNDFSVMVEGKFLKDDEKIRQDILSALLTCSFDKTENQDYLAFAKFNLDLSKSDFKFFCNLSAQDFYFTENGIGSFSTANLNIIKVLSLPSMVNFEARKKYAQSMINWYKNDGIKIQKAVEKEIVINDLSAYEITIIGKFNDRPVTVYQIVLGDNKATINFCSITYLDNLFNQAKEIGSTLKIK
ncbi:hypothetical protein ACQ9BO_09625 [Flavobacterium sp. P21]|uniref:hypothetical protein n=1 Tax=Flavobacterium sp. P21 TaxID=3423948 RepID=UPI003D6657E4